MRMQSLCEEARTECSASIAQCVLSSRGCGRRSLWFSLRQLFLLPVTNRADGAHRLDVPSWIKNNAVDPEKQKAGQSSGLKVAGSSGSGRQDEGIGIVMSMDKDEATRRQERDAEAAAKRQQNLLPAWHLKSTISGDLTALGIQENARSMAGQVALPSGDESLKGLGTIGPSRMSQVPKSVEDVRPEINTEADCKSSEFDVPFPTNCSSRL